MSGFIVKYYQGSLVTTATRVAVCVFPTKGHYAEVKLSFRLQSDTVTYI